MLHKPSAVSGCVILQEYLSWNNHSGKVVKANLHLSTKRHNFHFKQVWCWLMQTWLNYQWDRQTAFCLPVHSSLWSVPALCASALSSPMPNRLQCLLNCSCPLSLLCLLSYWACYTYLLIMLIYSLLWLFSLLCLPSILSKSILSSLSLPSPLCTIIIIVFFVI